MVSEAIVRLVENRIIHSTGTVTELDVVVCATGFDLFVQAADHDYLTT